MGIVEALQLCKSGWKVRPVSWNHFWVEYRPNPHGHPFFAACREGGIEYQMTLNMVEEFLGEWVVVEG